MRERLLHSMAASAAREAAGSGQERVLESPSTPDGAEVPSRFCHVGSPPDGDSCNGAFAEHSPLLEQSDKRALQEGNATCRTPVRWLSRAATVLLLLALLLLAFNRTAWRGGAPDLGPVKPQCSQGFKRCLLVSHVQRYFMRVVGPTTLSPSISLPRIPFLRNSVSAMVNGPPGYSARI